MNKLEKIQALMLSEEEANWRLGSLLCSEEEFMDVIEMEKARLLPIFKEVYNKRTPPSKSLHYLLSTFKLPTLLGETLECWGRFQVQLKIQRAGGGYKALDDLEDVYEDLLPYFVDEYKENYLKKFKELKYEQI